MDIAGNFSAKEFFREIVEQVLESRGRSLARLPLQDNVFCELFAIPSTSIMETLVESIREKG